MIFTVEWHSNSYPAASAIADTIAHHGFQQAEVAKAMCISPGLLSNVIRSKRWASAEFALRFEQCLGVSAEWILTLQSFYDYSKAHYQKAEKIAKEVVSLQNSA